MTVTGRCLAAILCAAVVAALALPATASPQPAIINTGYVPSGGYGGPLFGSATVGWEFTPLRDIWVTDLGFYDLFHDGLNIPHRIGIWNSQQELLVSEWGRGGRQVGEYIYAEIVPVFLATGQTYVIGATVPSSDMRPSPFEPDWFPSSSLQIDVDATAVDPAIQLVSTDRYYHGSGGGSPDDPLVFPSEHQPVSVIEIPDTGQVTTIYTYHFAPNFLFTEVPEPTTLALLALGGIAVLRRRLAGR